MLGELLDLCVELAILDCQLVRGNDPVIMLLLNLFMQCHQLFQTNDLCFKSGDGSGILYCHPLSSVVSQFRLDYLRLTTKTYLRLGSCFQFQFFNLRNMLFFLLEE